MELRPSDVKPEGVGSPRSASEFNVARLIQLVNNKDGEFFKYVPDELINEEQIESKAKVIVRGQEKFEAIRKVTEIA